ncbi:MAG: hypothetical protein GXO32_01375 [Crenarchaeota archaeon]|nr:hypothetical protein [Thermoproteota archaeon]
MMLSSRVRRIMVAMYVTEALGCAAWISTLFVGLEPRVLIAAMALTLATAVLHVKAVAADVEERIRRVLESSSRR